jgi:putative transposase
LENYEKNQKKKQRKRKKANSLSVPDLFPMSDFLYPGDVKHIGLKSTISSQILRKYSRNQDLKSVKNVKLIIPSQAVSVLKKEKALIIPCLKLLLNYHFSNNFNKISQIEIDNTMLMWQLSFQTKNPKVPSTI